MPQNTTTEKIEEITKKIDKKLSEELNREDVEEFLNDINVDLAALRKNAEAKYKETVEEKVKELKKIIGKNISEEPNWITTQDDLSKIKDELGELEKELKKLQISPQQPTEVGSYEVIELKKQLLQKEEEIRKLNQEIGARDAFLKILDERIAGMPKEEKLNINKVVEQAKNNWLEGFKVATGETDAGMGLITRPAAGLLAGGTAAVASAVHVGVYGIEKTADNTMEVYENTRKGAQEFSELIANNAKDVFIESVEVGAEVFENIRKGAENLATKGMEMFDVLGAGNKLANVLTEGISEAEKVKAEKDAEARIAEANAQARAEEAKIQAEAAKSKEIIESLRERLEEKDKQIKKLEEKNERLEKRIEKLEDSKDLLTAQVVESRVPSRSPSPAPSNF